MAIPNKIIITGNVYIKYIDDIIKPLVGDIILLLNDDAKTAHSNYDDVCTSGYVKAKLYDGLVWQNVVIGEFCHQRENKFAKKQRPIDSILLCQIIIKEYRGCAMYRTYRGHFTMHEYVPVLYERKSNRGRRTTQSGRKTTF